MRIRFVVGQRVVILFEYPHMRGVAYGYPLLAHTKETKPPKKVEES
jgi:hypothetical protein